MQISATYTVFNSLRSTKLIHLVRLPCIFGGKIQQQHFYENANFAFSFETSPYPLLEFSGTLGGQGVAFGAEVGYDTYDREFTEYGARFGVTKPEYHAALILADKGDTIKMSGLYHFNENQTTTVAAELTRKLSTNKNTHTVGGLYKIDDWTIVKARLNNRGKLATVLQLEVKPKSLGRGGGGDHGTRALAGRWENSRSMLHEQGGSVAF
uniref:Porin domain-containing protein n=1 Tax=Leersia perrieri TaxID=77586 RepID=A0A0D9W0G9_9ORYZ